MKKPARFLIYMGILGLTWYILAPALSINTYKIGAPIKALLSDVNTFGLIGIAVIFALLITYLITSGWGLLFLGGLAFCGLVIMGVLHPYLFPLLIPLTALWVACALARRRENTTKSEQPH